MVAPSTDERSSDGHAPPESEAGEPQERPSVLEPWLEDLGAMGLEARRWMNVQADRARLRARRMAFTVALLVPLVIAAATASVLAALHTVRGIADGWRALFASSPWIAEIATGVTVLGGLLLALRLVSAGADARDLAELRAKYEEDSKGAQGDEARSDTSQHA